MNYLIVIFQSTLATSVKIDVSGSYFILKEWKIKSKCAKKRLEKKKKK